MLHDLYLLSCYFDEPQAVLYEEDLKKRYGMRAVADALRAGLIEVYCVPCRGANDSFYCRISPRGLGEVKKALA